MLQAEGLEFTVEELIMLRDALVKYVEKGQNDELSDEDLEDVAGGFLIAATIVSIASAIVIGSANAVGKVTRGRW